MARDPKFAPSVRFEGCNVSGGLSRATTRRPTAPRALRHQWTPKSWLRAAPRLQFSSVDPAAQQLVGDLMLSSTTVSRVAWHFALWNDYGSLTDRRYSQKIEC